MTGPTDAFDEGAVARMREAAVDLRYLLGRGYASKAAIALVGDKGQLTRRERQVLFRCVHAPGDAAHAIAGAARPGDVRGALLLVDGYNVLITVESAVRGALLVTCDDRFVRDVAEVHGSYREGPHTEEAIALLARAVEALAPSRAEVHLDRPIAFSARLAARLRDALRPGDEVALADSADAAIKARLAEVPEAIAATSDGAILRRASRVFDLAAFATRDLAPGPRLQLDAEL